MIKKMIFFVTMILLWGNNPVFSAEPIKEQWFIQLGAYQSKENALEAQKNAQLKLKELGLYEIEREFMNFLSIEQDNNLYKLLVGAYSTQSDAKMVQNIISDSHRQTLLLKRQKESYDNFDYHYRFTLQKITESDYFQALKNHKHIDKEHIVADKIKIASLNRSKLENLKYYHHALNEGIEVIYDENEVNNTFLKNAQIRYLSQENEYSINCGSKNIRFPMNHFFAYFPQEQIILMTGEGFNFAGFSLSTCAYTKRFPFYIQYNLDKTLRINGDLLEPLGSDHFYIEVNDATQQKYVELFDIAAFFESYLDTNIHHLFWGSETEIYFIRTFVDETVEHYKIMINQI